MYEGFKKDSRQAGITIGLIKEFTIGGFLKEMTIDEIRKELGLASRNFYMGKLKNLDRMTPEKQKFMIKVTKLIATNSYLAEHMQGEMPEEIKKFMDRL